MTIALIVVAVLLVIAACTCRARADRYERAIHEPDEHIAFIEQHITGEPMTPWQRMYVSAQWNREDRLRGSRDDS